MASLELEDLFFDRLHVFAWGKRGEPVFCQLDESGQRVIGTVLSSSLLGGTIKVEVAPGEVITVRGQKIT